MTKKGWNGESHRHSLAKKGVKTAKFESNGRFLSASKHYIQKKIGSRGKQSKSVFYLDGYSAGQDAAMHNLNDDWKEIEKAYHDDELGEIVNQIREHQVQMAGDISYDVGKTVTENQYEKWENGFTQGFIDDVNKAMKTKKQLIKKHGGC